MPTVPDGMAMWHMLYNLKFGYYFVNTHGWQVEQPHWQMLRHIVMSHVGRCYAKVANGIVTTAKGNAILT